jgi:hypothetical protein
MYEAIKELPKEVQADVYDAIFNFSLNFNDPELEGLSKTIWTLVRPVLLKGNTNYINGNKAKTKRLGSETEAKVKPIGSEHEAYKDKDKDKDEYKDSNKKQKDRFNFENHSWFTDPEVNILFIEFLRNRTELKKPVTERACELLVKTARRIYKSKDECLQGISASIKSNWSDLYENKPHQIKPKIETTFSRSDNGLHFK